MAEGLECTRCNKYEEFIERVCDRHDLCRDCPLLEFCPCAKCEDGPYPGKEWLEREGSYSTA